MSLTKQAHSEKVVDLIQVTGVIMEKTAKLLADREEQEKKVSVLVPQAVQALLDNDRIEPHQKEAAEKVLQDPVKTLEVLIKTAAHRNGAEQARLGQAVPANGHSKLGSNYDSTRDNYVGRRTHPGEPESSKVLKRGLGLA